MQENLNTVTAVCAKAGVGQTAGDAKELWTKLLSTQNTKTSCFADSSFIQSSFAPPAVLSRVILCHQLFDLWSLGGLQIPTLGVSYFKLCFKSQK